MSSDRRLPQFLYTLACWGVLVIGAMFVFSTLRRLHLPPAISVYRNRKVDEYSWQTLMLSVLINLSALYIGITTKVGERKPNDIGYILRRHARTVGWMIGIGGWLATIHLLAILLRWTAPPQ